MISINHKDKMQFIKDWLSKESLYNFILTPEMHLNKDVYRVINDIWPYFHKEYARHKLRNLTEKNIVCQFLRKLNEKFIFDS
jgi:hypothetical protein